MKVAVAGCGNMAQALIKAMAKSFPQIDFFTFTPSNTRAKKLASDIGGTFCESLSDFPKCDYYLLACKPQQIEELAGELKEFVSQEATLISVLAGTNTTRLTQLFGNSHIVRVMPNTPSLIGMGANGLYFSKDVTDVAKTQVIELFNSAGKSFVFDDEEKIDVITPFSGSGPAYLFEWARIMVTKLSSMGVDPKIAKELVVQTFLGASELMNQSDESPEQLRINVTSQKGVTFEALEVFNNRDLPAIINEAIDAALKRAKELAK